MIAGLLVGVLIATATSMQRTRIVAMGDSTTAGTPGFMSPAEAPPRGQGDRTSQYAYWLMQTHPEWDVINQGINGERSDQIAARFNRDVISLKPSVVVLIAGVNDIYQGRPAAHVIDELRRMIESARQAGIKVVAGTIIPYNTASDDQNVRMREVNAWIRGYAASVPGVAFVDTRAAVAEDGNPDRLSATKDQLHPTAAGYRAMADAIRPVIEQMLR